MSDILAAFKRKEDERTLILSISSSSRRGEYLIGISLYSNKLIIAHNCPAIKYKRTCKHIYRAYETFKEWLWWIDLSDKELVVVKKELCLSPDWIQIPIPGTPPDFIEEEGRDVHSA